MAFGTVFAGIVDVRSVLYNPTVNNVTLLTQGLLIRRLPIFGLFRLLREYDTFLITTVAESI